MKKLKNNGVFYVVISLLGVLAIGTGVLAYTITKNINVQGNYINYEAQSNDNQDASLGSAAGNSFEVPVNFNEGFIKGGNKLSVSSTLYIARSITAAEVCNNKTLTVNKDAVAGTIAEASLDLTLPATSTLFSECLKSEGDEVTFDFLNQSPTAASSTEFVAGTGCQLVNGVADGDSTIPGQKGATVTIKRITDWLADGGSKDCVIWVYEWN